MTDFNQSTNESRSRKGMRPLRSAAKLVATVTLAALVGSGATLTIAPWIAQRVAMPGNLQQPSVKVAQTSYSLGVATPPVTLSLSDAIVAAVKKATPSVVGVLNMQSTVNASGTGTSLQEAGVGSGVIFSSQGYIVTNNHVVAGANQVDVVINQKKHVVAKVIGTDPYTDLAVLKVPQSDIQPQNVAQFGNSATLQPGEPAIAIGNPAGLAFSDTVTVGVISATQRTMPVQDELTGQTLGQETVLQTDAAINPGNSGGPLLNALGQVVGINSSKIVAQGFSGMGFAIPINMVRNIITQLIATGTVQHAALGIEGIALSSVPPEYRPNVPVSNGVWVYKAVAPSAKASGLQRGDVIVAVSGQKITGLTSLQLLLSKDKPGQTVQLTIYRGQKEMTLTLQLTHLPTLQPPANAGGAVIG